jgi:hypothetical protein
VPDRPHAPTSRRRLDLHLSEYAKPARTLVAMPERDWYAWHDQYDVPDSALAGRLRFVRERVRDALDNAPPGPLRVVSLCAGQGRDVIDVLATHPRRRDTRARLVELDPRNATVAAEAARGAGLDQVEIVLGDAALTDLIADLVPVDLLLLCGIFGNITDADIENTIAHCDRLCKSGGIVLWTRHRRSPDRVPKVCRWFAGHGFDLRWLSPAQEDSAVGAHRFTGEPRPLAPGTRLFTFVGRHVLAAREEAGGRG